MTVSTSCRSPDSLDRGKLHIVTTPAFRDITSQVDTTLELSLGPLSPIEEVSPVDEGNLQSLDTKSSMTPLTENRSTSCGQHDREGSRHSTGGYIATKASVKPFDKQRSLIAVPVQSVRPISPAKLGLQLGLARTQDGIVSKGKVDVSRDPSESQKQKLDAMHESEKGLPQDCRFQYTHGKVQKLCSEPPTNNNPKAIFSSRVTNGRHVPWKNLSVFPQQSTRTQIPSQKIPSKNARYDFLNGHVNDVFPGHLKDELQNRPADRKQQGQHLVELEQLVQNGQNLFSLLNDPAQSVQTGQVARRIAQKVVPGHVHYQRDTIFVARSISSGREMINNIESSISNTSGSDSAFVDDLCANSFQDSATSDPNRHVFESSDSETSFEGSVAFSTLYNLDNVSLGASIEGSNQNRRRHSEIPARANRASYLSLLSVYSADSATEKGVTKEGSNMTCPCSGADRASKDYFCQPPDSPTYLEHLTSESEPPEIDLLSSATAWDVIEPDLWNKEVPKLEENFATDPYSILSRGPDTWHKERSVPVEQSRLSLVRRRHRSTSAPSELKPRSKSLSRPGNTYDIDAVPRKSEQKKDTQQCAQSAYAEPDIINTVVRGHDLDVASHISHKARCQRVRDSHASELAVAHEDAIGIYLPSQRCLNPASRPQSTVFTKSRCNESSSILADDESRVMDQPLSARRPPSTGFRLMRSTFGRAETNSTFSALKKKKVKKLQIGAPQLISSSSNIATVSLAAEQKHRTDKLSSILDVPRPKISLLRLLTSNCNRSQASLKRCLSPVSMKSFHTDARQSRGDDLQTHFRSFDTRVPGNSSSGSTLSRI